MIENHTFRRPDIARVKLDYEGVFTDVSRSTEVFPEVERELRARGLHGLSPAFFQALFAALPVQCFEDITPTAPDLLGDRLDNLSDDISQSLRERAADSLRPSQEP